ncbi:MAG: ATP-binding protein [Marinobacter sp.]|nr:ATP-binding protein [Marinobacter sp.]
MLVDLDNLLRISELDYLSDKAPVAIRGYNGLGSDGRVFVGPSDLFEGEHLTASVALPEGSWEVGVAIPPAPSFHDLPGYIWGLIVSAALLISTLLYLLLRLPFRYQQAVDNAKNDLSQSNARFKDAIESLPDGLSVFDSNDRLIRCNRKYREFFASENIPVPLGLSFEELLRDGIASGHYLFPDIKASTREAFFAKRMSHHLNPTPEGIEIHIADGRCLRAQESRIPSGGTVVAYSDVSELKNKEHELANAKKKAETANEAKTAFLATVSHELRTPLNAILGLLNLVQMSGRLEKTDQNFIDVTYESAEHLLNLLNELLDLSKMESNKLELESNTFNLACITRKAITLCANRADQKEISLIEDVDDTADVMVIGDAGRLQQILLNLISNSLKFSDQGLVTVSVEKTKNLNDEMWFCFRVVDTGIGFTDAQAKSLFQPFSQLDSTASRKHEGTGLGLAICKRLVELMGGKIWAQGELGKGATFEFEIPFFSQREQR